MTESFVFVDAARHPWKVSQMGKTGGVWVWRWSESAESWIPLRTIQPTGDDWMFHMERMPPEQVALYDLMHKNHS